MVEINPEVFLIALVPAATILDFIIGDPEWTPHPVQVLGWIIKKQQIFIEKLAGRSSFLLTIGGFIITITTISISGGTCWLIEHHATSDSSTLTFFSKLILLISLSSALAGKSLSKAVKEVLTSLPGKSGPQSLELAKSKLSKIVGRDVRNLDKSEIIRAAAETASENAVDGIFAPLFWMLIGVILWNHSTGLPGPLTLTWIFKTASTLDSMLGYKKGKLLWLGRAGAKLDDLLTWIPCRIVVVTLPIISNPLNKLISLVKISLKEGLQDPSPNSGYSQAIFANCAKIKMGGPNSYNNEIISKPTFANNGYNATSKGVYKILTISRNLELLWVSLFTLFIAILNL